MSFKLLTDGDSFPAGRGRWVFRRLGLLRFFPILRRGRPSRIFRVWSAFGDGGGVVSVFGGGDADGVFDGFPSRHVAVLLAEKLAGRRR